MLAKGCTGRSVNCVGPRRNSPLIFPTSRHTQSASRCRHIEAADRWTAVVVAAAANAEAVPEDEGEADQFEDITDLGVEYAEPPFDGRLQAVVVAAAAAGPAASAAATAKSCSKTEAAG